MGRMSSITPEPELKLPVDLNAAADCNGVTPQMRLVKKALDAQNVKEGNEAFDNNRAFAPWQVADARILVRKDGSLSMVVEHGMPNKGLDPVHNNTFFVAIIRGKINTATGDVSLDAPDGLRKVIGQEQLKQTLRALEKQEGIPDLK